MPRPNEETFTFQCTCPMVDGATTRSETCRYHGHPCQTCGGRGTICKDTTLSKAKQDRLANRQPCPDCCPSPVAEIPCVNCGECTCPNNVNYADGPSHVCPSPVAEGEDDIWKIVSRLLNKFNVHKEWDDTDCVEETVVTANLSVMKHAIVNLVCEEVRKAKSSDRNRVLDEARAAVRKACPLPTWAVPVITSEMPDDPGVAADQCRIETVRKALNSIDSLRAVE